MTSDEWRVREARRKTNSRLRRIPHQHSALSISVPTALSTHATKTPPTRGLAYWNTPRTFTLWQRIQIAVLPPVAVLIINCIGKTLRWETEGDEHLERVYREGKRAILVCWHCCTFASTYYWRHRGIIVMSSQNFESECLAGVLED